MHQNVSTKGFIGHAWYLHFSDFFLEKRGTLKQGAITYSAQEFILWAQVKTCSGDPRVHHGTNQAESWGGCRSPAVCSQTNTYRWFHLPDLIRKFLFCSIAQ